LPLSLLPATQWLATPLQDAAYVGHVKVVRLLLQSGAVAHLEDQDGRNAWAVAQEEGEQECLDAISVHVSRELRCRQRLAWCLSGHRRMGICSDLLYAVAVLLSGAGQDPAAMIARYLKERELARVAELLLSAAAASHSDSSRRRRRRRRLGSGSGSGGSGSGTAGTALALRMRSKHRRLHGSHSSSSYNRRSVR
jgi:hypothetical protein